MEKKAIRVAYGEAIVKLGAENDKVVVFDADLAAAKVEPPLRTVCLGVRIFSRDRPGRVCSPTDGSPVRAAGLPGRIADESRFTGFLCRPRALYRVARSDLRAGRDDRHGGISTAGETASY